MLTTIEADAIITLWKLMERCCILLKEIFFFQLSFKHNSKHQELSLPTYSFSFHSQASIDEY